MEIQNNSDILWSTDSNSLMCILITLTYFSQSEITKHYRLRILFLKLTRVKFINILDGDSYGYSYFTGPYRTKYILKILIIPREKN